MRNKFYFETEPIALPTGAWSKPGRQKLQYNGRDVLSLTQGEYRTYLYPVFTRQGFAITSESPVDHPHHNSIWIGADNVRCIVPGGDGKFEEYTYNFYVNETFQGRAPGRIVSTGATGLSLEHEGFRIKETLEWRSPPEWGAPETRLIMSEQRTIDFTPGQTHHVIDIESELRPALYDVELGPTRHGFFNIRAIGSMQASAVGRFLDADGRSDSRVISGSNTCWVNLSGPIGGGHNAGITVMPHPDCGQPWWFVSDWGVMTTGHFRHQKKRIRTGESVKFGFRVVVHDHAIEDLDMAGIYSNYLNKA
jgi:hypothetical protein